MAYNNNFYSRYYKIYNRIISSIFIKSLLKQLREYIAYYLSYQLNQTYHYPIYGELHPISTPTILFHTMAADFIVALLECNGYNALIIVSYKVMMRNLLILSAKDQSAVTWANAFITNFIGYNWGILSTIISDYNPKFLSSFWKEIFSRIGMNMLTSTVWHPQTDGILECMNQTIEIALRFFLLIGEQDWVLVLLYIQGLLNNSIHLIDFTLNDLLYRFRVREGLDLLASLNLDMSDLNRLYIVKRQEAIDAMAFMNIVVKTCYNKIHKSLRLYEGSFVYLRLHYSYKIPNIYYKYSNQQVGLFKVLAKVGKLVYRLELPPNMKIYLIISMAQIEPALDPADDLYHRLPPPSRLVEEENTNPLNPLYKIK